MVGCGGISRKELMEAKMSFEWDLYPRFPSYDPTLLPLISKIIFILKNSNLSQTLFNPALFLKNTIFIKRLIIKSHKSLILPLKQPLILNLYYSLTLLQSLIPKVCHVRNVQHSSKSMLS